MNDFNINYDRLKKIRIPNYMFFVIIFILLFILIIFLACKITISKKITCYGIIEDGLLHITINEKLSDKIKNNHKLIFNNKEMIYKINKYGNYNLVNNEIIQDIYLTIDRYVYDNEIGMVTITYDKLLIIKFIFELFK